MHCNLYLRSRDMHSSCYRRELLKQGKNMNYKTRVTENNLSSTAAKDR